MALAQHQCCTTDTVYGQVTSVRGAGILNWPGLTALPVSSATSFANALYITNTFINTFKPAVDNGDCARSPPSQRPLSSARCP